MPNNVTSNYTYYNKTSKASSVGQGEFWYDDGSSNEVSMQSFLQLMIAQLQNQDFNNTVDDTQYITQLAQFSSLQAMNDLTANSKLNYASSLVGKEVAVQDLSGREAEIIYGRIEAMSVVNGEPVVYINNKEYSLSAIQQVYPDNDVIDSLTNLTSMQMMSLASSLMGTKVDVVKTTADGSEIVSGTVESIARVNGESVIYVDGVKYSLGEVVKVYPRVSDSGEKSEETTKEE